MKKYGFSLLALASCAALLSGCGENANSTAEGSTASKEGVVLLASSEAEFAETADTLQELAASSDFIAKVKVTEADAYVYPNTDAINTKITPEILELYKGTYDGEALDLCGGYMRYSDYYSAPIFQEEGWNTPDTSAYTEEELKTAQIYWDWCNNYVPAVGDTILFFGKESDNNTYTLTNSYQGLFRLAEGNWINQALEAGGADALANDLLTLSGAAAVADTPTVTFTCDGITYTKQKANHEAVVSIPEETLLDAVKAATTA